jgi:maltose O-acetyltransferase
VSFVGLANLLPPLSFVRLRTGLLRLAGLRSGDRTAFGGRVRITGRGLRPASRISVGDNCWINDSCTFDASATITIGNGTAFGHEVALITSTHDVGSHFYRAGTSADLPIVIGDGAWIGARAMVLPGVTVGAGSIVAAGSVVNRDIAPDVLAAGVPAKVIRRLDGCGRDGP